MATKRNCTTRKQPVEREVYRSPEGRVVVTREGTFHHLYLDGFYSGTHDYQFQAVHEGGVWLNEQAEALAVEEADKVATIAELADELDAAPTFWEALV